MRDQDRIDDLLERLDADGGFATAMEVDAFTTLTDTGFDDLAVAAAQERDRIGELVDRIYSDDAFRRAVEEDPAEELGNWGIPEIAFEPVLILAGAPDEVVARATADVEAHLLGKKPATLAAMTAMLGALAFAQQASAGAQPAQASLQAKPASHVQVSQPQVSQAQVFQAQVSQAQVAKPQVARAQVAKPAYASWQGVQANRLTAQGTVVKLLRTQAITP